MQNMRVVLVLVLIVAAVAVIGFFVVKPPSSTSDAPGDRPVEEPRTSVLPKARPGAVTGDVRVFKTGEPAGGIPVKIEGAGRAIETETDRKGSFRVTVPSGVVLTVTVDAPDPYAPVVVRGIQVEPGRTESLGTLNLEKAFLVRGIVVDRERSPIAGARVAAHRPTHVGMNLNLLDLVTSLGKVRTPLEAVETGTDGTFAFKTLSPGTYRFEADAEGFATAFRPEVDVSPERESRVITLVLVPGLGLSGSVKNTGGFPVPEAVVTAIRVGSRMKEDLEFHPVQTRTDDTGNFEFTSLAPGQAGLMVRAEGYPMSMVQEVNVGQQDRVDVVIGGDCAIEGKVSDEKGEPIEGAEIMVVLGRRGDVFGQTSTDGDGKYLLANLPAGRIQFFSVRKEGYPSYPKMDMGVSMRGFGELDERKTLVKDVTLAAGATITGRVTDESSGQPVAGAEVSALGGMGMFGLGGSAGSVTDKEGVYRIEGIDVGQHLLLVKAAGYFQKGIGRESLQRAMIPFGGGGGEVSPDAPIVNVESSKEEVVRDIALLPGATVSGTVVAPDGTPVSGARVTFMSQNEEFAIMTRLLRLTPTSEMTNEEGAFRIAGVAAGDGVVLRAEADGFVEGISDAFSVSVGSEASGIVVRLKAAGSLNGTVYGADGDPIKGAMVRVVEETESDRQNPSSSRWRIQREEAHLTGADGGFRVEGLKPGPVIVGVEAPGHRPAYQTGITVPEGAASDGNVIRLEKGMVIAGRVVSEDGAPVAGGRIWVNPEGGGFGGRVSPEPDGTFRLDQLAAGSYSLTVSADGYASESRQKVPAGTEGMEIVLVKGMSIEGRVTWPDGSPAGQIWVSARGEGGNSQSGQTGAEGEFVIKDLRPGTYAVTARPQGGWGLRGLGGKERPNARESTVDGVPAGTSGVVIRLEPGFSITGIVVDESGAPLTGANLSASPRDDKGGRQGPNGWTTSDDSGSFEVIGLDDGAYRVTAWKGGYAVAGRVQARGGDSGIRVVMKKEAPRPPVDSSRPITVPERIR